MAIPEPIRRHLSAILLLTATLLLGIKHTGFFSFTSTLLSLTFVTYPLAAAVPMLILIGSFGLRGSTLTISAVPTAVSNTTSIVISSTSCGRVPGFPTTEPMSESLLVNVGSSLVPIATRPPGLTDLTSPAPVPKVDTSDEIGSYFPFSHPKFPVESQFRLMYLAGPALCRL